MLCGLAHFTSQPFIYMSINHFMKGMMTHNAIMKSAGQDYTSMCIRLNNVGRGYTFFHHLAMDTLFSRYFAL